MSDAARPVKFFVGRDVGGWNCDRNDKSRNAVVILDETRAIVGRPWRGNLRTQINAANSANAWIKALFDLCGAKTTDTSTHVYLAIDTPLGFSDAFIKLVTELRAVKALNESRTNPYLFRATERILFEKGATPLSAVKDVIGSQATMGIHVLAKFAREIESCGVCTDGNSLNVLEVYPSACRNSAALTNLRAKYDPLGQEDKDDALTCALIANLYAAQRDLLAAPDRDIPAHEGWIWSRRIPSNNLGER
jgi:predicted nuclease with RNAse H fold